MIDYFNDPGNTWFVLIIFGLFMLDYILERIESRKLSHHHKPSLFGVLLGATIVITVSELLFYLVKLLISANPVI